MAHKTPRAPRKRYISYNGKELWLYSIGWFATVVNRTPESIKFWEKKGVMPKPLLDSFEGGWRMYSADELVRYAQAYNEAKVQRGQKIEGTQFRTLAMTARKDLRSKFERHPETLMEKLPNENLYLARLARQELEKYSTEEKQ